MASFDIKVEKDVLVWNQMGSANDVSAEEAKSLAERCKTELGKPNVNKLLADNRSLKGVYKQEVNEIWMDLMKWVATNVEKNATITADVTLKMQLNRISRESGTYDKVKAFTDEKEAREFVGL